MPAFALYPLVLSVLPLGWKLLAEDARTKVELKLKAADALNYKNLRAQALRCAR